MKPKASAEYLQSFNRTGLLPLQLELKVDPVGDLCNGTRLTMVYILEVYAQGSPANELKWNIRSYTQIYAINIRRRYTIYVYKEAVPVKLCFAIIINKSQGQLLVYVGVDQKQLPFMYGQPYVSLPRSVSLSGILIFPSESSNTINNIVYPKLLLN